MDRYTLENKRVVIIGGSSGIGLATAIQAAEAGASIVIAGRSSSRLEAARNQIEMARGAGDRRAVVDTYVLDNQDEQQIETFLLKLVHSIICSPWSGLYPRPANFGSGDSRKLLQG